MNIKTQPFYTNFAKVDPQKSFNPMSDFTFAHSFNGDDQLVQVLARRDLDNDGDEDDVSLNYSINGGPPVTDVETEEWIGGDRYGGPGDTYYHIVGGHVLDAPQGSNVKVWFTGAGKTSDSFTFHVDQASADDVLILADTDYTGTSNFPAYPAGTTGPPSLDVYEDAVDNAGYSYDTYDVDALGAPDHLGVLSHYDAVIWYTADDLLSRIAGQPGGTGAETQANTMMLQVRAYLNEGGRLLYTGRHAGWQFANAFDYNPVSTPPLCDAVDLTANDGCLFLSDDFLQYWLGAYLFVEDGGADPETGDSFDASGFDPPFGGASTSPWAIDQSFEAGRDATNQSFVTTSSILKVGTYPQFTSTAPAKWDTGLAGAYSPHTGTQYLYSQRADIRYQRLLNTLSPTPGDDHLSFFMSHDTELDWDFVFVEAHTPGQDDWVTLPAVDEERRRDHEQQHGRVLPRRLGRAPPVHRQHVRGRGLLGRQLERDLRPLTRLAAVERRPVGMGQRAGRGLDLLRERLVIAGPGRVGRRHRRSGARGRQRLRGRPRHLGRWRSDGRGERRQRARLDPDGGRRLRRGRRDVDGPVRRGLPDALSGLRVRERQRPGRA